LTADLLAHIATHLALCATALALAIVIALPAAALATSTVARSFTLGMFGALRVVPSIAVLALALPYLGLGFRPAVLALVLLAIPPIAINADAGLRGVAGPVIDAARGMGMTAAQVRARIAWPLAVPLVLAGIRTATVEVIASATLAAFIGAGGLGEYIIDGLATNNTSELIIGAATVAALALVADLALAALVRRADDLVGNG
jgi:osmoprotectant transport system permease protein